METYAIHKNAMIAPRKARMTLDLVRGKKVAVAGVMAEGLSQEQAVAYVQANPALVATAGAAAQEQVLNGLLAQVEDMEDGFDEYILSLSAAYQMTDAMQVAVYGEYTFDEAHKLSQNGTDVKAELGVRLNVQF